MPSLRHLHLADLYHLSSEERDVFLNPPDSKKTCVLHWKGARKCLSSKRLIRDAVQTRVDPVAEQPQASEKVENEKDESDDSSDTLPPRIDYVWWPKSDYTKEEIRKSWENEDLGSKKKKKKKKKKKEEEEEEAEDCA